MLDAPRSGAPRTIEDAKVDTVIAKTLESVPEDAMHWSTFGESGSGSDLASHFEMTAERVANEALVCMARHARSTA